MSNEEQPDLPGGDEQQEDAPTSLKVSVESESTTSVPDVDPTPATVEDRPAGDPKTFADFEKNARSGRDGRGETLQELAQRQALASGKPANIEDITKAQHARPKKLPARRLRSADEAIRNWSAIVEHGTTPHDILDTSYWEHHGKDLRPGDEIRVQCEDGSWVAWVYVQGCGPRDAKVAIRQLLDLDPIAPDAFEVPHGYSVAWGGALSKWRVLRGPDVIKDQFDSRTAATRWLGNHLVAVAR